MIHGQEGRGRYKAFALGSLVRWKVCYDSDEGRKSFAITLNKSNLVDVIITDEVLAPERNTGVIVEIENVRRDFRSFETDDGVQDLAEIFALYLMNYRDVKVSINGRNLEPQTAIYSKTPFLLNDIFDVNGDRYEVALDIIEWRSDTKRTLYLCSANGFPLDQHETRFHVPGFSFSAYLKSDYVEKLHNDSRLGLAEMDPGLGLAVQNARDVIKTHFRNRASERARTVVNEWQDANIYPYDGEPQGTVEKAERQVFDIVAAHVQEVVPDLAQSSPMARALHLRMLRSAIERGPEELQLILNEALNLPAKQQKDLAGLLQETTLTAIITSAKTIADRLKFISALESIVFDPETKQRFKERSQLHKILADNTWIFGEEYNLWVNDKDLRNVLVRHKKFLHADISIDEPVKVIGQSRAIIDLMLSRSTRRHRADDIEHLVVELKAPKVVTGEDELAQIRKYSLAVRQDERFRAVKGVRWHFWVISNSYNDLARDAIESGPDQDRRVIAKSKDHIIGIKTWGEIIEENRARLQFFQEQMQHTVSESEAVAHLQEKYSRFLEGVIVDSADETEDDSDAKSAE